MKVQATANNPRSTSPKGFERGPHDQPLLSVSMATPFVKATKPIVFVNKTLELSGYSIMPVSVDPEIRAELRESLFREGEAGTRCLLDDPTVVAASAAMKAELITGGLLPETAVAVQAIAFDKSTDANWNVGWHQDLLFPFAKRVTSTGYLMPCVKVGIHFARPPLAVLERLLAVRLHLDACDETNGPLRVVPGSHRAGVIPNSEIVGYLSDSGEARCLAAEGEALLMRPLLLHASSKATRPRHRRVLHVVYYTGREIAEQWHRAVR
jgi:hypothetical protein